MELRLRGVTTINAAEEYLLLSHLINKEREQLLYYELIAVAGMNEANKDGVTGVKELLKKVVRPELDALDKKEKDVYTELLAEEVKKIYKLTYGGAKAMSDNEVALAFGSKG